MDILAKLVILRPHRRLSTVILTMTRQVSVLSCVLLTTLLAACGSGSGTGGGGTGGGGTPQNIPTLSAIAPSSATTGAPAVSLVLYGSNFENAATVQWHATVLSSTWVSATEMTATIPASDVAPPGSAKISVSNPNPGGGTSSGETFTIAAAPTAANWARAV